MGSISLCLFLLIVLLFNCFQTNANQLKGCLRSVRKAIFEAEIINLFQHFLIECNCITWFLSWHYFHPHKHNIRQFTTDVKMKI